MVEHVNDAEPDDDLLEEARLELDAEKQLQEPRPFIFACNLKDIPKNGSRGKVIFCEHDEVALFNLAGKIYAISNICPHQSSPLLSEGYVDKEACTVACPLHGWTYRIDTGKSIIGDGAVTSYHVRLVEGEVWIEEPPFRNDSLVSLI